MQKRVLSCKRQFRIGNYPLVHHTMHPHILSYAYLATSVWTLN